MVLEDFIGANLLRVHRYPWHLLPSVYSIQISGQGESPTDVYSIIYDDQQRQPIAKDNIENDLSRTRQGSPYYRHPEIYYQGYQAEEAFVGCIG